MKNNGRGGSTDPKLRIYVELSKRKNSWNCNCCWFIINSSLADNYYFRNLHNTLNLIICCVKTKVYNSVIHLKKSCTKWKTEKTSTFVLVQFQKLWSIFAENNPLYFWSEEYCALKNGKLGKVYYYLGFWSTVKSAPLLQRNATKIVCFYQDKLLSAL